MRGIDIDEIEPRFPGTKGRQPVQAPELPDIGLVHGSRLRETMPHRHGHRGCRNDPGEGVVGRVAAVPQFDTGERTVTVHGLDHGGLDADVVVVPQGAVMVTEVIRRRIDGAVLGAHDAPTAFGLDPAHGIERLREGKAHARAMWYLIEPVGSRDRSDTNGLEQDVVARIACHGSQSPGPTPAYILAPLLSAARLTECRTPAATGWTSTVIDPECLVASESRRWRR